MDISHAITGISLYCRRQTSLGALRIRVGSAGFLQTTADGKTPELAGALIAGRVLQYVSSRLQKAKGRYVFINLVEPPDKARSSTAGAAGQLRCKSVVAFLEHVGMSFLFFFFF